MNFCRPGFCMILYVCFLLLVSAAGSSHEDIGRKVTIAPQETPATIPGQGSPTSKAPEQIRQPSATARRTPIGSPEITSTAANSTPYPELLTCPDPAYPQENLAQAVQILYANEDQLWLWDEASQEKILVNLPAEAVSPQISPALLFSEIPAGSSSCRSNQIVAFA